MSNRLGHVDPALRWQWGLIQFLFVLSGACALAYEVLWGRWLSSVLGSSATAACVVLASYMGGQAAGAALFGGLSARLNRPLWAYIALEVAIGVSALLFPLLTTEALGLAPSLRVVTAVAVLATPTVLLGGTVPLVIRWSELVGLPAGASLGRLYGLNTIGAALGTLVAGFVLIPNVGLSATNLMAALGNWSIALAVIPMALRQRSGSRERAPSEHPPPQVGGAASSPAMSLYVAAFLSGCVSLGIEVIFIRLLRITLASTTYVFTLVIATFVLGIGIGGLLAGRRAEGSDVSIDLARGQVALLGLLVANWLLVPYTQTVASAFRGGFEATLIQSAIMCAFLLLPATILMGFLFPLLGRLFMNRGERGREVGALYMLNTLGAVTGSIAVTIALIPLLGASYAYLFLTFLAFVSFCIYSRLGSDRLEKRVRQTGWALGVVLVGCVVLHRGWSPVFLGISGGYLRGGSWDPYESVRFFAEGRSSNVLVAEVPHGLSMVVDGKPVASTSAGDRANQLLLGHLPALLAGSPESGLVVGMGTAMTLGALAEHDLETLDIVELEPRVPEAARFFSSENGDVLDRPELRVTFDDGYNFLHGGSSRYDVITSDPIHPFVRGGSTLYSADYFARGALRLSKRGVFAHWLPLANLGDGDFRMIVRNFTGVFPYVRLYWNGAEDSILVGRKIPWGVPAIDPAEYETVALSLASTEIGSADELEGLAFADRETLVNWAKPGPTSTIDLPLLEFSAPRAMHRWTLNENLMTLHGWRERWRGGSSERHAQETAAALEMYAGVAPQDDPAATRDFLVRTLDCGTLPNSCQPHFATRTMRNVFFAQVLRAAQLGMRQVETGGQVAKSDERRLIRELVDYAALLLDEAAVDEVSAVQALEERLSRLQLN